MTSIDNANQNYDKKKVAIGIAAGAAAIGVTAGLYALGKQSPKFSVKLENMAENGDLVMFTAQKAPFLSGVVEGAKRLKKVPSALKNVADIIKDKTVVCDGPSKSDRIKDLAKKFFKYYI